MKRIFLLFIIFGFLIFGCGGDRSKIRVLSIGKPYAITGEELCKKQHLEGEEWCKWHFYFDDDIVSKSEDLKVKTIAVPIETNFSMVESAGYVLRECLFEEEIIKNSKHGYHISVFPFERGSDEKGFFILNINKFKKLNWLDKDNLLTKSICTSPLFGSKYYKERKEIDAQALKNAIDEIEAQEGQK